MKAFSGVIAFVAIVLSVDLCLGADRIRFAYPAKSLNYLPVMLGRDKGIYQTEGIDLQMVLVTSPVQVTALTTSDIDFSGAQSQVMAGAARGLPVKVVGFITTKPSFWLMAKPEIKSMPELKGKIIGITAIGSSTDTLARALLSKSGLTPDRDFTLFGTGTTSNILIALKGGSVDAGVLSPPFNAMAKLMGFRMLAYFGDDKAAYPARSPIALAAKSPANKLPMLLSVAEYDPVFLVTPTYELATVLAQRDSKTPQFAFFAGHNHVSTVMSFGTAQDDVGSAVRQFVASI